jgi:hypothetical protein
MLGALVLVGGGCLSADRVELVIVGTEPIEGAPPPTALRARIIEAETGNLVVENTVESGDGSLGGLGALRGGVGYVLALEAFFGSGICADDRAVGVSMPFVHQAGSYSIPIQVGCADEFGRTVSQPIEARLAPGLETAADGTAVLAGGAESVALRVDNPEITGVVGLIERYMPFGGGFIESGSLVTARAYPALQAVPEGGVAVFGGVLPGIPACEQTIELIVGAASTAKGPLSHLRCEPDATLLSAIPGVMVGGGSNAPAMRSADFEVFDLEAEASSGQQIAGQAYRRAPRLIALGDGETALAIGGTPGAPAVEAVHLGDRCPGSTAAPCTFPIPAEGLDPRGLESMAAAYAECPSGGGAVYITGGIVGDGDSRRALDQILCVREETNLATMRVVQAGTLPEPRARHEMAVVRGSSPRLLLVGGGETTSITNNLFEDALLVPVDPCTCDELSPQVLERLPLPLTGAAVLHRLTTLQDGSVLLVGGVRIFNDAEGPRYEALGEAALFVPEIP